MFYVLDLSKPRKYIQWKVKARYDDIMLEYKLNSTKINKALIVVGVMCFVLVVGTTANAAEVIDKIQFNYVVDHFVNDLKYPRGVANNLVSKLSPDELRDLYSRVQQHDIFMNQYGNELLGYTNKITNKAIEGIKTFIELYNGF